MLATRPGQCVMSGTFTPGGGFTVGIRENTSSPLPAVSTTLDGPRTETASRPQVRCSLLDDDVVFLLFRPAWILDSKNALSQLARTAVLAFLGERDHAAMVAMLLRDRQLAERPTSELACLSRIAPAKQQIEKYKDDRQWRSSCFANHHPTGIASLHSARGRDPRTVESKHRRFIIPSVANTHHDRIERSPQCSSNSCLAYPRSSTTRVRSLQSASTC